MAEPPRFWPQQGPYMPQAQPQIIPTYHGDGRPLFSPGMPPGRPFGSQQWHVYPPSQPPQGYGGYVPWGSPAIASPQPFPPHFSGSPHGSQFRPTAVRQMGLESGRLGLMTAQQEHFGRRPPNPRSLGLVCEAASGVSIPGNGQLLVDVLLPATGRAAVSEAESDKNLSLKDVLKGLQDLIVQAEDVVSQLSKFMNLALVAQLATCPSDHSHRVPPASLFQHIFRCPSSPLRFLEGTCSVVASQRKQLTQHGREDETENLVDVSTDHSDTTDFSTNCLDFVPLGGHYFYGDAPAVVQCAQTLGLSTPKDMVSSLPLFLIAELGPRSNVAHGVSVSQQLKRTTAPESEVSTAATNLTVHFPCSKHQQKYLFPSDFLALGKEVEAWECFPSSYSALVLIATMGCGGLKSCHVSQWLLINSPYYGVVLDRSMAKHVSCLVILCLKALLRESQTCALQIREENPEPVISEIFEASGNWLASQLEILYGSESAKSLALAVFKHAVISSGRMLASTLVGASLTKPQDVASGQSSGDIEILKEIPEGYSQSTVELFSRDECSGFGSLETSEGNGEDSQSILENVLRHQQVVAAGAHLQQRAALEKYLNAMMTARNQSMSQLSLEYEDIITRAAMERLKRPNLRPVLEHDGLIWNRNQQQESKKNKTKEELIAEERDYKRRRMSYRGKKVRRTPTQVLHDIIEGHMQEIRNAGGIGCFVKEGAASELPSENQAKTFKPQVVHFQETHGASSKTAISIEGAHLNRRSFSRPDKKWVGASHNGSDDVGQVRVPAFQTEDGDLEVHRTQGGGHHQSKHVPDSRGSHHNRSLRRNGPNSWSEQHHSSDRYHRETYKLPERHRGRSPSKPWTDVRGKDFGSSKREDRWEASVHNQADFRYQGTGESKYL